MSESSRFYDKDGSCADRLKIGGKWKKVRIDIAGKYCLAPSSTTILKLLDKPFVTRWMVGRAVAKTMELVKDKPKLGAEALTALVRAELEKDRTITTDTGKILHAIKDRFFQGTLVDEDREKYAIFIEGLAGFCQRQQVKPEDFIVEQGGYHPTEFFGGQEDAMVPGILLADLKSCNLEKKRNKDGSTMKPFYEHGLQLASYDLLFGPFQRHFNWYVDRETHELHVHEWQPLEIKRLRSDFLHLKELWFSINRKHFSWYFKDSEADVDPLDEATSI